MRPDTDHELYGTGRTSTGVSPNRYLRALRSPRAAFDGWTPGAGAVLGLVVGLCALDAASVALAGDAVAAAVDGTVTVDNPARPPDWVCEGPNADAFGGCDAPETVQRSLRPAASAAVSAVTLKAALAPLAWVLFVAGVLVVASGRADGDDGDAVDAFRDGAGVAALAAVPGALRYLARPVAVERSLAAWTHPESLDGVRSAAVAALFPDGPVWLAAAAVSGVWTAAVVYGGARAAVDAGPGWAALVAAAALATASGTALLPNGGWFGTPGGLGLLLVAVGVVGLLGAYTFISVSKEFELVGFSGSERVTPEPWYVGLHRLFAVCLLAAGFLFLDGLALA